jgi:endonuclease YncB( thermonuclease family)
MNKFFTLTICLILPIISFCQTINGKVVRIADGDTVTILDSENNQIPIRLYGIDCPENGQDFSNVAKMFTSDLCFSKTVTVDVKDIDRYGRTVGIIWTSDSVNVNLELLKAGLAWHYKYYDQSEEFAQAERLAKANKIGLWKQPNAISPWEYRRK